MKLFKSILTMQLLWLGAVGVATPLGSTPVTTSSGQVNGPKGIVNLRDYGVTGDGRTNDTLAVSALLTTIGASSTRLIFPPGFPTLLNTISFPGNVTLDFSAGGALKPVTGQTITILGRVIVDRQQIFFNALAGEGTVDFTGNYALEAVCPEWWGASPNATAGNNTPAIQAAILGACLLYTSDAADE